MLNFRYRNVELLDFEFMPGPENFTSEELEEEINIKRFGLPGGTIERLTGIKSRKMWPKETLPSQVASEVAQKLLARWEKKIPKIGLLINFSVSRDYFEPATSVLIHRNLNLSKDCMCFDISNACIGFSNALSIASSMIESGKIEAALLVACETVRGLVESTIHQIKNSINLAREEFLRYLPVLTLGSGAVACLVTKSSGKRSLTPLASACASHSEFADLCEGNADFCVADYVFDKITKLADKSPIMRTEARKLIQTAAQVGKKVWNSLQTVIGWSSNMIDRIICHQVGKHVNESWYQIVGLDKSKEITIYPEFGNMGSVALPAALILSVERNLVTKNQNVLTLGFGSGLNAIFTAWKW